MFTQSVFSNGILANNTKFFGSNTAETISVFNAPGGSWNRDNAFIYSSPWITQGGTATNSASAGIFAFNGWTGGVQDSSHRTILLGY
ncbi:hypothetical protein FWG76_01205 [Candidatus Saccharibacteria bacterium]|nr:hypothetical protein [Candidatus Saccharibacteria bacterium]